MTRDVLAWRDSHHWAFRFLLDLTLYRFPARCDPDELVPSRSIAGLPV
jgi:hypothetical protein